MESFKKRLNSLTGTAKVHPHDSSHGKPPHSGYDFGTEMKEIIPKISGGKKRTRRVKHRRSKHRKSKSRRH